MTRKGSSVGLATVTPINDGPKRRRKYTRLTAQAKERLTAELEEMIAAGACSKVDYSRVAERFNVSVRTVENHLAAIRQGGSPLGSGERRTSNVLPDGVLIAVAEAGQRQKVFEDLKASGEYQGSRATFYRQTSATFGARTLRGITSGVSDMRRGTFEQLDRPLFMQGFSLDLFYLRAPLSDTPPDSRAVGAVVRESSTGVLVFSWLWPNDQVTSSDIATVLAESFRGRIFEYNGEGVFVGGVPDFLRVDNGSQFTSRDIGSMLNPLGVRVITSNDYRSHENGAHEAVHRVLRAELLDHLPGSESGLRDHRGELLPDSRSPITLHEARDLLDRWAWAYNVRAGKDGSRMDAWVEGIDLSGGLLPNREDPEALAGYAIERTMSAKLYKPGLLVDTYYYTCPQLENYQHKRFVVRQWLRDERTIEVFTPAGRYVGVAARNGQLTAAESGVIQREAKEAELAVKEIARAARDGKPAPRLPEVPELELPIQDPGPSSPGRDDGAPLSGLAEALRQPTVTQPTATPEGDSS